MDEEAENDNTPKLLKLSSPRNPGGSTDPNDVTSVLDNIEAIFMNTFFLKELTDRLKRQTEDFKSNEMNRVETNKIDDEDCFAIFEEIKSIWESREQDIKKIQTVCNASTILKKLTILIDEMEKIGNIISEEVSSPSEDIHLIYKYFIRQLGTLDIDRLGDPFTVGDTSKKKLSLGSGPTWQPSIRKGGREQKSFALGATRESAQAAIAARAPPLVRSKEHYKLIKIIQEVLECLNSLETLSNLPNWSTTFSSQKQNKEMFLFLCKLKEKLTEDQNDLKEFLDSFNSISISLTATEEVLIDIRETISSNFEFSNIPLSKFKKIPESLKVIEKVIEESGYFISIPESLNPDTFSLETTGITLKDIIEAIVSGKLAPRIAQTVKRILLTTLTYFTTPDDVLDLLILRYCTVPYNINNDGKASTTYDGRFSRCEIVRIIRSWIVYYYERDFISNPELLERVKQFAIGTVSATGHSSTAYQIISTIEKQEKECDDLSFKTPNPTPDFYLKSHGLDSKELANNQLKILSTVDPLVLAVQLTYFEFQNFYRKLRKQELTLPSRNENLSSPLKRSISHFNRLSAWVVRSILSTESVEERGAIIRRIIVMALHMLRMDNYNGTIELVSALNNCAIERLNCSWNAAGEDINKIFLTLDRLIHNKMNVFKYLWNQTQSSSIPYIGVFLTDLTFIEDGMPSMKGNLINFKKFAKINSTIDSLLKAQSIPYDIEPNEDLQTLFNSLPAKDTKIAEESWWNISKSLESNSKITKFTMTFPKSTEEQAILINELKSHPIVQTVQVKIIEDKTQESKITEYTMSLIEVEEVLENMRLEVFTSHKRKKLKTYRDTFDGEEGVCWIMNHFSFDDRKKAIEYFNMLIELKFVSSLSHNCQIFKEGGLYRFV